MTQHQPQLFTYATPVACQHCGGKASLMRRTPDPGDANSEIRTFECESCRKQTVLRAA